MIIEDWVPMGDIGIIKGYGDMNEIKMEGDMTSIKGYGSR